ncbi:hypothetical protein [Kineosporia sp. NBRC 101731]|uniref:hypothetical protein n=1 Tax=Kineosporia sp. NBRC 101731 TaxID=3032199 RepID=UPI0025572537|nr:hypothetical protein [Kineosporia sp. NBRC 101731]
MNLNELVESIREILFGAELNPDKSGGGHFESELEELTGTSRSEVAAAVDVLVKDNKVVAINDTGGEDGRWVVAQVKPGVSLAD